LLTHLRYPEVVNALLVELERFNSTAVPPANKPADPRADPRLWNYTWTNFGDYQNNDSVTGEISLAKTA